MSTSPKLVQQKISETLMKSEHSQSDRERFAKACLLEPRQHLINVDDFHAKNLNIPAGECLVWFITFSDPQSVFWDERSGLFGVCWGPDLKSGAYDDLGYRSDDPLEMFLV